MSNQDLILSLAKVLISAAWADGELTHEEVNSMKDLLFRIPELTARQWASLQMYLEAPVDEAERGRLVEELRRAIRSRQDQALALRTLDEMLVADGVTSDQEEKVASEIRAAIESVDVGLLGQLFRGMTGLHAQAVAGAPNREQYLDEYLKNKVYYGVQRRLQLGEAELSVGDETLRTLSLAGGIMARVAQVNPQVSDAELATMVDALQTYWHLSSEEATFVAGVAISETASLLDPSRLAREFADACGPQERAEFLDVLFAVAAADGEASYDEIEEIRNIARSLKLSHEQFIEAKLKLPREQRRQ
jgi:uncharacterized tellurite resistance protein B-like protein